MKRMELRPAWRRWGKVCLLISAMASVCWMKGSTAARAETGAKVGDSEEGETRPTHVWLPESEHEPAVLAFRPNSTEQRKPLVVMLHGMCDPPERECPYFANTVTEFAWLVCPRARLRCRNGGTMWEWRKKYDTVDAAVERIRRHDPEGVDAADERILVGFSLGALAAMDIAHRGEGRWQRLLLIGAEVYPNAELLKKAGVKRVLLASGDRDMMRWHMTEQARRLNGRGVPAKFMSMGPVGHWFAPDMDAWLR
ncbi:MAG: alpha/beta hydrolase, partial [Myxococcota bacterium]